MLEGLAEVNHHCLGLLSEQAVALGPHGQPALRQVGELWRGLDERSRWRAAACPYLLIDACFAEPQRWQWLSDARVSEGHGAPQASFFTVPQTATVARMVFVYAWSLVLSHSAGARLVLGIHPQCARLLGGCMGCRARWPDPAFQLMQLQRVDQIAQCVGCDRLHQMMIDTRPLRAAAIVFLAVAGDGDEHGNLGLG